MPRQMIPYPQARAMLRNVSPTDLEAVAYFVREFNLPVDAACRVARVNGETRAVAVRVFDVQEVCA